MRSEAEIRATVRLAVAEHFASTYMACLFLANGYSDQEAKEVVDGIISKYAVDTWGTDPAMSDLFSAEAEDAARDLLARALRVREELKTQLIPPETPERPG